MLTNKFFDAEPMARLFAKNLTTFIFEKLENQTVVEFMNFKKPHPPKRVLSTSKVCTNVHT